ncbi:hypothetical protein GCM10009409_38230 [Shewanella saliphila]|uniref:Uncharacterized protein n=2 Tax=Shewanella saliphila TaxID=2282698 RepID=A0ABQ2QAR8_9GAMM|nr:hypothetical protein GCM10009409_38230 [Shewanella saliphila]
MIIKIDESISKALEEMTSESDAIELLRDLEYNRGLGYIAIEISKSTCLRIMKSLDDNDKRIENFLKKEKSKITFNQELFDSFNFKLYVYHSDFHQIQLNDDSHILFDIKNYSTKKYSEGFYTPFNKPKLITENSLSDGKVLKKICENHFRNNFNVHDYQICIERKNGGGDGTGDEISDSDTSWLNLFSIIDSDKKHPQDNYGETAKKVIKSYSELNLLHNYRVLNVHEIENLFPLDWFLKKANQNQKDDIILLKRIYDLDNRSLFYYDFKKSFGYKAIFLKESCALASYWKPIFETTLEQEKIEKLAIQSSATIGSNDIKILGSLGTLFNAVKKDFLSNKLNNFQQPNLNNEWDELSVWMIERFICSKPCRF